MRLIASEVEQSYAGQWNEILQIFCTSTAMDGLMLISCPQARHMLILIRTVRSSPMSS